MHNINVVISAHSTHILCQFESCIKLFNEVFKAFIYTYVHFICKYMYALYINI